MENSTDKKTKYSIEQLREMQSWNLDRKIATSIARISEFYSKFPDKIYVSFSGRKRQHSIITLS